MNPVDLVVELGEEADGAAGARHLDVRSYILAVTRADGWQGDPSYGKLNHISTNITCEAMLQTTGNKRVRIESYDEDKSCTIGLCSLLTEAMNGRYLVEAKLIVIGYGIGRFDSIKVYSVEPYEFEDLPPAWSIKEK